MAALVSSYMTLMSDWESAALQNHAHPSIALNYANAYKIGWAFLSPVHSAVSLICVDTPPPLLLFDALLLPRPHCRPISICHPKNDVIALACLLAHTRTRGLRHHRSSDDTQQLQEGGGSGGF